MEDKRGDPSIYVGETSRSLAERTTEHWKDASSKEEESHMRKHWNQTHSDEEGPPKFRFEVVKFCRTALERQIGEATRIALRKNCLNSKAGYNRSGVTRLTLKPEEIQTTRRWMEGQKDWDKEGLEAMRKRAEERGQTVQDMDKKRKAGAEESRKASKKTRRLKYRKIEDDWGVEDSGIREVEEREVARTRFLQADLTWAKVGVKQTKIRIWSEAEVLARKIITDCISQATSEAAKEQSLTGEVSWLETDGANLEFENIPDGWGEENSKSPDGWKTERQSSKENRNVQPDGRTGVKMATGTEKVTSIQTTGRVGEFSAKLYSDKKIAVFQIFVI